MTRLPVLLLVTGALALVGCDQAFGIQDHELAADAADEGDGSPPPIDGATTLDAPPSDGAPTLDASGDQEGPDVATPSGPQLSVGSPALDFSTLTVGQSVSPETIDVTNTGKGPTGALTTALAGSADYTVMKDGCSGTTLAPQSACHVQIALNDATAGMPTGSFTITDTPTDTAKVQLSANILAPGALQITPQSWAFAPTVVGTPAAGEAFVVKNTGSTSSGVITTTLTPTNGTLASELAMTDACAGKTLAPSDTCTITVVLTPASAGSKSGSLTATATPGGTAAASLTGSGLAPASLSISPSSYTFPNPVVVESATPPTQTFQVTNNGGAISATLSTTLTPANGTASSEFKVTSDGCSGKTLAANASCSMTVQFSPATFGSKSATLSVSGASATLAGTGEDFQTLTVTETGTGSGTVTGGTINCPGTCTAQVARTTSSSTITLTAAPAANSTFSGWGGACSGTGTCSVTMSQAQTVSAQFTLVTPLTVNFHSLSGQNATLTSSPAGIDCSGTSCSQSAKFVNGSNVVLTVSGTSSGALVGWSNGCSGSTCTVTLSAATTVSVTTTGNNIVFVSDATANAGVGLAGADAICTTAATNAGLPGTYVAFLATSTTTAFSRLGSARGWIRPDGLPFGDTVNSLENYVTYYPPSLDENGGPANTFGAWTGVDGVSSETCGDWTSTSSTALATSGIPWAGSTLWAYQFVNYCNAPQPFYCFGTSFASAVSAPTATGRYVFVSSKAVTVASISAADAECQSEAQAAGLANSTSFLAMLSTTTSAAESRFNLSGANWVRPDGVMLASSPAAFMAGTYLAPYSVMANGQPLADGFLYAWMGARVPNAKSASLTDSCNDWSSVASSATGEIGYPATAFEEWTAAACNTTNLLICVEN